MRRPAPRLLFLFVLPLAAALFAPGLTGHGGGHQPPVEGGGGPGGPPAPPPWGGPGDTGGGPRAPGPARPSTPGPSGPSTPAGPPAPSGPKSGVPTAPGVPGLGGPMTPGGGAGDLAGWRTWWELNQHEFLALRDAIARGNPRSTGGRFALGEGQADGAPVAVRPTPEAIAARVRPALLRALAREGPPDVVTSALTSLARLGPQPADAAGPASREVLAAHLSHSNQQVAETAALALGILGDGAALSDLAAVARGGRGGASTRTRAFAAAGLGLFAARAPIPDQRRYAVHALVALAEDEQTRAPDVRAGAFNALAIAALPRAGADEQGAPAASSAEALAAWLLAALADRDLDDAVRAHVPRALARQARGAPALEAAAEELLIGLLRRRDTPREVRAGCVQALGLLGAAGATPADVAVREALLKAHADGDEVQRGLALIALGKIGGRPGDGGGPWEGAPEIGRRLARELARGKTRGRQWAALALGVQGHAHRALGLELSEDVSTALRARVAEAGDPDEVAACALALGLRGDTGSYEALRDAFQRVNDAAARGTVALGLGLAGERRASEPLHASLDFASYQPDLLRPLCTALVLLGDATLVPDLVGRVRGSNSSSLRAIHAWALAYVGDARAVDPLIELLDDGEVPTLTHGNAALGLGWVCEPARLPWGAELAADANYVTPVATLWSPAGGGVLNVR